MPKQRKVTVTNPTENATTKFIGAIAILVDEGATITEAIVRLNFGGMEITIDIGNLEAAPAKPVAAPPKLRPVATPSPAAPEPAPTPPPVSRVSAADLAGMFRGIGGTATPTTVNPAPTPPEPSFSAEELEEMARQSAAEAGGWKPQLPR